MIWFGLLQVNLAHILQSPFCQVGACLSIFKSRVPLTIFVIIK